jgi:ATP-dependent Clp protease ATP-binding subunit ClpX
VVREPAKVLDRLMAEGHQQERAALQHDAQIFAEHFSREHNVEMRFDESALGRLVVRAEAERMTMNELCAHLFKDFQFGLSLIRKNTGRTEFVLDAAAVDAPDKFLSDLVLRSYGPGAPAA